MISFKGIRLKNIDDSKEGIKRFLERNPDTCFVAEENLEIIGVIIVGNDGRIGYIYHTAVSPLYSHKGIATKMVNTALEALSKIVIINVALVVFDRNES